MCAGATNKSITYPALTNTPPPLTSAVDRSINTPSNTVSGEPVVTKLTKTAPPTW